VRGGAIYDYAVAAEPVLGGVPPPANRARAKPVRHPARREGGDRATQPVEIIDVSSGHDPDDREFPWGIPLVFDDDGLASICPDVNRDRRYAALGPRTELFFRAVMVL